MTNFRKDLVDRMIRLYGFENPMVIDFCFYAEGMPNNAWNNRTLELLVEAHEAEAKYGKH